MKIYGIILQNFEGENLIISTRNNFNHEMAYDFSNNEFNGEKFINLNKIVFFLI